MEKNIAHKFCSTSNAFSSLALLLSCVYGCYGNLFRMSGNFSILASWNLFLANWENFNKLFLYGYLWYGFCGGTATMSVIRWQLDFGKKQETIFRFIFSISRYSRPHLHGALSEHHQLSVWVTSTLGLSKLAAQFYFYNFEIVQQF